MQLLRRIEGFLKDTGMPASKFGRLAVGDPRLVHDLRKGREAGGSMQKRVTQYIASHLENRA